MMDLLGLIASIGCLAVTIALGVAVLSAIFRRPLIDNDPISDVLILAAHQDDCVIMAGEYALAAKDAGKTVRVVYLTCGSDSPSDARAIIRKDEARKAWGLASVPSDHLLFFDLPQSQVGGPSKLLLEQVNTTREGLDAILRTLPRRSSVFIPAAGEAHCDHLSLRSMAIAAWTASKRNDLKFYEVAEYNAYYSLWRGPLRAVNYVARTMPIIGRFCQLPDRWIRADFICGGRALRLPLSDERANRKKDMLRAFSSEDGDLLVRYFGYPDQVRPLVAPEVVPHLDVRAGRFWLKWGSRNIGSSLLLLWAGLWLLCVATSEFSNHLVARVVTSSVNCNAAVGAAICSILIARDKALERRVLWAACAAGLFLAMLDR